MDKRLDNAYYHGIKASNNLTSLQSLYYSYQVLCEIIEEEYILSRALQGKKYYSTLNGYNAISLCKDLRNEKDNYSPKFIEGYTYFVIDNFSIIISSNLPNVYRPKLKRIPFYTMLDGKEKATDMYDEWRVKDQISLKDYCIGIGIPALSNIRFLDSYANYEKTVFRLYKRYLENLKNLLNEKNIQVPLYDTELKEEIPDITLEYMDNLRQKAKTHQIIRHI